jgi:hypothetical protein
MTTIKIPCFVAKATKSGQNFFWQPSATLARAGWTSLPLGKDRHDAHRKAEARNQEVERWKAGGQCPADVAPRLEMGTLGELVALYRRKRLDARKPNGSPRYSDKTKTIYETSLKRLEGWAGKRPLDWITRKRVAALREASLPVIGHSATFNLLKILRQVLAFAVKEELLAKNNAEEFELPPPPARRQLWEAEDEAAFIAAAYELGLPGMALALELALYTAQRVGDLIRFSEPQLQELELPGADDATRAAFAGPDGRVRGWCFNQAKTSDEYAATQMEIPLEPRLLARVEAALRDNRARDRAASPPRLITRVLVEEATGHPWNEREFHRAWTAIKEHAAARCERPRMLDLVWHDLRRTRVVRCRRRGMAPEMIATITGHSPRAIYEMLKVYGPVDATMTAMAIASTLSPLSARS